MKLPTSISLPNEPWLEKWARLWRFRKTRDYIATLLEEKKNITLIDFGCGQDTLYYTYLSEEFPKGISKVSYIGIDPLIKSRTKKNHRIVKSQFEKIKLTEKADVIVMLAVIEHVDDPSHLLLNALRLLKPNGIILATTPSPFSKPILEFFSSILGIISKREIDEHKRYPTRESLLAMIPKKYRACTSHEYFEFGLNNFIVISL